MTNKLTDIFSLISSLRDNLPEEGSIKQDIGREYNDFVRLLEKELNIELPDYKISADCFGEITDSREMHDRLTGKPMLVSQKRAKYIDRTLFKTKIDALVLKFTITQRDIKIGFTLD